MVMIKVLVTFLPPLIDVFHLVWRVCLLKRKRNNLSKNYFSYMHISGFEKFTLLDYPGKMVAVVFTPGCVFRCPFCHNPELIEPRDKESKKLFLENKEKEFFEFLEKRKGKLDGVCITGGEPTLQKDLLSFIKKVKKMGFLVKLDTNGLFPDRVEKIMDADVVDYWAIDIKHTKEKYHIATGKKISIEKIERSVQLLMKRAKDYEFRTTVVPGIHEEKDFNAIADWIDGAKAYYLQEFRGGKVLDPKVEENARDKKVDLDSILKHIGNRFEKMEIRR